jgi:hypothetical protein
MAIEELKLIGFIYTDDCIEANYFEIDSILCSIYLG